MAETDFHPVPPSSVTFFVEFSGILPSFTEFGGRGAIELPDVTVDTATGVFFTTQRRSPSLRGDNWTEQ